METGGSLQLHTLLPVMIKTRWVIKKPGQAASTMTVHCPYDSRPSDTLPVVAKTARVNAADRAKPCIYPTITFS